MSSRVYEIWIRIMRTIYMIVEISLCVFGRLEGNLSECKWKKKYSILRGVD